MTTFALDTDHHALAVNVGGLKTAQLGSANGGGVQSHEQGGVKEISGGVDELSHFLRSEHDGQSPGRLGKGDVRGEKMGFLSKKCNWS